MTLVMQVIVWVFLVYLAYGVAVSIAECRERHRRETVRPAQAWYPAQVHHPAQARHTAVKRQGPSQVEPPSQRVGAA